VSGQLHALAALTPETSPLYSLYRGLGGPRGGLDEVTFLLSNILKCLLMPSYLKVKVKVSLGLTKHHVKKAYWGVEV
jgi:hypothetical protein